MSRSILIWTDDLRRGSKGIGDVADTLADTLNRLHTTLQAFGAPWGTTLLGTLIGQLYNGIHDAAMEALGSNAETMSEYAVALETIGAEVDVLVDRGAKDLLDAQIFLPARPQ